MEKLTSWVPLGLLVWFLFLHGSGLYLFTRGFLLTRVELNTRSLCSDLIASSFLRAGRVSESGSESVLGRNQETQTNGSTRMEVLDPSPSPCWVPPAFQKAIIVIIDALRFDFVSNSTAYPSGSGPWVTRLSALEKIARAEGRSAAVFKFVADPPTTSLQRLKGLTTGGLPTFVDVGSSFGAPAIAEDNLIDQLKRHGKRLEFLGDDTWMDVFPHQFARSKPLPSLVVKDIDTVDDGILADIYDAIKRADWDILIAHFLGVDHVGHTFEVNSQTMLAKLDQMNAMVEDVLAAVKEQAGAGGKHENSLLLFMGDHAQTMSGDHGGGTPEETDTALLAVSMKDPQRTLPARFRSVPCSTGHWMT